MSYLAENILKCVLSRDFELLHISEMFRRKEVDPFRDAELRQGFHSKILRPCAARLFRSFLHVEDSWDHPGGKRLSGI